MKSERILLLEKYLEEDPANPFNYYALALEFVNSQPERAQVFFDQLLERFPDYLATYYQAASLYMGTGHVDKGVEIATAGVAKAIEQKNAKAKSELQNLINSQLD